MSEEYSITPEELDMLYNMISKGNPPTLQWKSPGRIEETPSQAETSFDNSNQDQEARNQANDYDFMEEAPMTTEIRSVRTTHTGSAKKKTANFDGVIDSMKKHGRMPKIA